MSKLCDVRTAKIETHLSDADMHRKLELFAFSPTGAHLRWSALARTRSPLVKTSLVRL